MLEAHNPEIGQKEGPGLRAASALSLAPIHPSAWKRNSRKFTVASDPFSAAPSTPERHSGTPSASKPGNYVPFVAPLCINGLRLVTAQLPEKSWPIGLGHGRSSS